jgi:hypothetical protein
MIKGNNLQNGMKLKASIKWFVIVNLLILLGVDTIHAQRIRRYSIPGETRDAIIDRNRNTVEVEMPYGTDLTNLVAEFRLTDDTYAYVDGEMQVSGETPNDFTEPVTYRLIQDEEDIRDWVVNVTLAPNSETDFLSYSFPEQTGPAEIDYQDHTIDIEVAYGTDVSDLVATFELSYGAYARIGWFWIQESGVTSNDFRNPVRYLVVAEDGRTSQYWTVTVTVQPYPEADILAYSIPNEVEEAKIDPESQTVEVIMPFGTDVTNLVSSFTISYGATATVGNFRQISGVTSNDFTNPVTYTITGFDGSLVKDWIVTVTVLPNDEADILSFSFPEQMGEADLDNRRKTVDIEVIYGTDPSSLVASFILSPQASATVNGIEQISGTTVNDFSSEVIYLVTAGDGSTEEWIITVDVARNTEKYFVAYNLPGQVGETVFNDNNFTIEIDIGYTTELDNLVATFALPPQALAQVDGVQQESGVTPNNFSDPLTYRIIAGDQSTANWEVHVNVLPNNQTDFVSFSFVEQTQPPIIDTDNHTIDIEVEYGTNLTDLVATFTLSPFAAAYIGTELQESGITSNDFSAEVVYTILAGDNVTNQDWRVNVTIRPPSSETDFIGFTFDEQTGDVVIDTINHEIYVMVDEGTQLNNLIAIFELSTGATAYVGSVLQVSGFTINDFESPVTYTIVAENGEIEQTWTVFVSIEFDLVYIKEPTEYPVSEQAIEISARAANYERLEQVNLHYKKIEDSQWSVSEIAGNMGIYKIDINEESVGKVGMYYFIEAIDTAGYRLSLPLNQVVLHYNTSYPEIPDLRFGETVNHYQIIGIPLNLERNNAEEVFDELGEYNIKYWRLFHYSQGSTNEYQERFTTIEPGLGYWLIVRNPTVITSGEGYTVQIDTADGFEIDLEPGWNQIGNPFDIDISWDGVIIDNRNLNIRRVKTFNRDTLTETSYIPRFRGGFVFLEGIQPITVSLKPSSSSSSVSGRKAHNLNTNLNYALDQSSWYAGLKISNGTVTHALSGIGMHPEALEGKDWHDEVLMPVPKEIFPFQLVFNHPDETYTKFSKDVVKSSAQHIWEFEVKSFAPSQKLTISWDNTHFGNNELQLYLNHRRTEKLIDMKEASSYTFSPSDMDQFRIVFGDKSFINNELKPAFITLGDGYPNPFNDILTIPFSLPENDSDFLVNISIYDIKGGIVKQLINKYYAPGYYNVAWNSSENIGVRNQGMYFIRMVVKSKGLNKVLTRKVIQQ